jgi:uncharacterized protein YdbL (DUF1318 family)
MNRRQLLPLFLLPLLAFMAAPLCAASAAATDRKAELQERFKSRLEALDKARKAGAVGECFDGRLAAVNDQALEAALQKLVEEENTDRQALYRLIAEEEKTTPDLVARRDAARRARLAGSGEWLKPENGPWQRKP